MENKAELENEEVAVSDYVDGEKKMRHEREYEDDS